MFQGYIKRIITRWKNINRRNDELYLRKIKIIRKNVLDYYLVFNDKQTALRKTNNAMLEAIKQDKIDMLYTKHKEKLQK